MSWTSSWTRSHVLLAQYTCLAPSMVCSTHLLTLQSAPELARLLGEDIDGEQTALFENHNKTGTSNRGPGYSVQGVKGGGSHATSPDNPALAAEEELTEEDELVGRTCKNTHLLRRGIYLSAVLAQTLELSYQISPAFTANIPCASILHKAGTAVSASFIIARIWLQRTELEAVKRERSHLMTSLAEIKTQSGKAGGELQQEDVRRLRKEVELKMEKLNEIRKVSCFICH